MQSCSHSAVRSSDSASVPDIYSPENRRRFADHLFCQRDYLRAVDEYQAYLSSRQSDTVLFRVALSYSGMGRYKEAVRVLEGFKPSSGLYRSSRLEAMRLLYIDSDFLGLQRRFGSEGMLSSDAGARRLFNASLLKAESSLPEKEEFLLPYSAGDREQMEGFYERKVDPSEKSALLASVMSAVIPGSGKVYAGRVSDGITAFVVNGLLAYGAYDNFRAGHRFRAWAFTAVGAWFYLGNIYGTAAAVRIYNEGLAVSLGLDVDSFLGSRNYFIAPSGLGCR